MENHILDYNKDVNLLTISSSNTLPLKIEYNGNIELQVNGQFNLSTINNPINIDSFNSNIFLNSSIKEVIIPKNTENTELTLTYTPEINNLVSLLLTRVSELETRIKNLENKKNINEIKFR
jgi:type VI protein secretion system component Hcp